MIIPCVITYSIGFDDDPNESQLFREALQSMLGPGKILVASAGNEGFYYTYLHKPVGVEAAGAGYGSEGNLPFLLLLRE